MHSVKSCRLRSLTKGAAVFQKTTSRHRHRALLTYGEDVADAKEKHLPIVALESTIITHGMPYPDNVQTALEVEEVVRKKGAVPATIAVLDGTIKVGATPEEIERLGRAREQNLLKISRREFAYALSRGLTGGTTVSGSMLAAWQAGIRILATGGIGGVHRQVEASMDVSADLKELGQTPVAVVCSGVKAILDIAKTLEYLESEGVPVASIGPSDKFPAFYSRESFEGLRSPARLDSAEEAARLLAAQARLRLGTGVLLAVPVPEAYSLDPREIELAIERALEAARAQSVSGKGVTPFLLAELSRLTGGRSLTSNKALIKNNAAVAAETALHLAEIEEAAGESWDSTARGSPVVIGGATFDTILRVKEPEIKFNGSTHRGESRWSCGGVGRNLVAALVNLGMNETKLLSVIGDDEAGKAVVRSLGTAASSVHISSDTKTARYTAVVDQNGNCCFGIGEMEAFDQINSSFLKRNAETFRDIPFLVIEGNPSLNAIKFALDVSQTYQIPVWYEPTDINKALKIFECGSGWKNVLRFISPNINELMIIANYFKISTYSFNKSENDLERIKSTAEQLIEYVPVIITTLGAQGVLVSRKASKNEPFLDKCNNLVETNNAESHLYPPLSFDGNIASVSGCGDCLAAGIITGILRGWKESSCISLGLYAAKNSLVSFETVPDTLKSLPKNQDFYFSE